MASRRTPPGNRRRRPNEPSFPVIPIAVGVVVLGFAIGAGIPALRGRHAPAVAQATASPPAALAPPVVASAQATDEPSPSAPPATEPPASPSPRPKRVQQHATPSPAAATPAPTPDATLSPVATPTVAPPAETPSPQRRIVVAATAPPTAAPKRVAAAPPATPVPVATLSAPPPTEAPSPLSPLLRDAQQTVRTYIQALASGDEGTASAQLLANTGTSGARLSEKAFLDPGARIVDMTATATSPTTANVDVDVRSAKGLYYAHYEVRRLDTGVTLIREHNFVKP